MNFQQNDLPVGCHVFFTGRNEVVAKVIFLPPATKLGQGNIFRSVCPHSVQGGVRGCSGACVVAPGGMHGCSGGRGHGCSRGVHGCSRGGGMCGCSGGGGMHGCSGRGMHGCSWGGWDMTRYGDTVNEWAVCMLLECILFTPVILFTGGVCLSACWDTTPGTPSPLPPGKQTPAYGQWAAGRHPTGMHSCSIKRSLYETMEDFLLVYHGNYITSVHGIWQQLCISFLLSLRGTI